MKLEKGLWALVALAVGANALPARDSPEPNDVNDVEDRAMQTITANTPAGTIRGLIGSKVESFRGIPYAEPPVGPLRLKPPKRYAKAFDDFDGTNMSPGCPQMIVSSEAKDIIGSTVDDLLDIPFIKPFTGKEDCLTISVHRPKGTEAGSNLPVLFWIFGGGFQFGAVNIYDPTGLIEDGMAQGQPFIFVAVNYRVGGFGFLPGAEVQADGSANLGLLDQRMGLEWVQDNIAAFGGDPTKVTLWGESAGSISILDQMALYDGKATYKGKNLFRGAIMSSGSMLPAEPVDCPKSQATYDQVVDKAGCAHANDTLSCLRSVDYEKLLDAFNSVPSIFSYTSLSLSYFPRPDGHVLRDSIDKLVISGQYHAVPMIIGDQEDEGTLFSLFQPNISTGNDIAFWLQKYLIPRASMQDMVDLVSTYDDDISAGSPFRTGFFNNWYPGFKRMAAVIGDLGFTLARRRFLNMAQKVNPDVPSWSYLSSYFYGTPILGTCHGSDLLQIFYGQPRNYASKSTRTYYYNFLHNLDPNVGVKDFPEWPRWSTTNILMWFKAPSTNGYIRDDFRTTSAQWIEKNSDKLYM